MKIFVRILILNLFFSVSLVAQQEEIGIASFYSDKFHGKPTASGELYNKNEMTGAHKTLPFGTIVKVTRMDNGKSVRVKITDRGPFISGRVVEISRAAADKIGLVSAGVAEVRLDVVKELEEAEVAVAKPKPEPKPEPKSEPTETVSPTVAEAPKKEEIKTVEKKAAPVEKVVAATKPTPAPAAKPAIKETPKSVVATKESAADKMALVRGNEYEPFGLYSIQLKKPAREGYGVQVASLGNIDGAFRKIAELQGQWFDNILMNMEKGTGDEKVYKIILGPFDDQASANAYNKSLKKKKMAGFVVSLAETEAP